MTNLAISWPSHVPWQLVCSRSEIASRRAAGSRNFIVMRQREGTVPDFSVDVTGHCDKGAVLAP